LIEDIFLEQLSEQNVEYVPGDSAASYKQCLTCIGKVAHSAADIRILSIHILLVIVRPVWIPSEIGKESQELVHNHLESTAVSISQGTLPAHRED
jgi:hypothetical protein